VSKKTRPRRSAPSSKASTNRSNAKRAQAAASAQASARAGASARADAGSAFSRSDADALVQRVLSKLWGSIEAGDPLQAELETSTCMAIPRVAGQRTPEDIDSFVSTVLVDAARRRETPDGAALLRVLMSLGTPGIKRSASQALAELTSAGVFPPEWVTEVGKVEPIAAWRRYDVFGDDEAVTATFRYGEDEHAMVVQIDRTGIPIATAIGMVANADALIEALNREDDEFERPEKISLAQARWRLEGPLIRSEQELDQALPPDTIAYLPLSRSRVRRLPAEDSTAAAPEFTAADRAASVDEFMKSPLAADAVAADEDATRFWAEVVTGYSSRIAGEPPTQVGPRKLAHILLGHVPNTFVLSPAQRQHLEPAVTAWARWSAEQRELSETVTARLLEQLPDTFGRFDEAYDDPDSALVRGYVSDLSASDVDVAWLAAHVGRRMFALPMPTGETGPSRVDVGNPADRQAMVAAEFGGCTPPPGMTSEEFVAAAFGVIEELWRAEEENAAFETARRMFAEGIARHDLIHRLAGAPAPTRGSTIIADEKKQESAPVSR
jgi:hypothetical protein